MDSNLRRDVNKIIDQHSNSFESAVIYRASAAAGPMVIQNQKKSKNIFFLIKFIHIIYKNII
jgi:hypothetical protein